MTSVRSDTAPPRVRVYEAGRRTKLRPISYLGGVLRRRKLMFAMAQANRKAGNMNTILGQLWLVLGPLTQAAVYVVLIGILRGRLNEPGRLQLIVVSIFLFTFTRTSVQRGSSSVVTNGSLLLNSSLPRAVLPTTAVLGALLDLLPGLAMYAIIHVVSGLPVSTALVALPGLLALHALFNLGAAMLVAIVAVYIPDVQSVLGHILRLWMYMTPVLYPVTDLRRGVEGLVRFLQWNPVWHLFDAYHRVILEGLWPTTTQVLVTAAWATALFVIGSLVFISKERFVATRI